MNRPFQWGKIRTVLTNRVVPILIPLVVVAALLSLAWDLVAKVNTFLNGTMQVMEEQTEILKSIEESNSEIITKLDQLKP